MNKMPPLILILLLGLTVVGCQKVDSHKDQERIRDLEKLADDSRDQANRGQGVLDTAVLGELGRAYLSFAQNYPQAVEAPEYLFRAGEVYSNELKDFPKAIGAFEKNFRDYPNHETAGNALFFVGYLYNNSLGDIKKARESYEEFLEKYPGHKLAPDAKFELKSLGMSMEDVFNQLIRQDSSAGNDSLSQVP
jgi:tetratricopeptide (TPR) repeat protein